MAKNRKQPADTIEEPVGLPAELQVDMDVKTVEQNIDLEGTDHYSNGQNDETLPLEPGVIQTATDVMTVVVLQGNAIHHNGERYSENQSFSLTHGEAERLIQLGVVMKSAAIQQKRVTKNSSGVIKITQEG
ncbi:hypothetical protein QE177_12055 [Arsenophonus sp. aPb]|uniref:hypothetical protein n=1 Tax=Arsenophonus sp. aPb TaxID=3041619 RepID=UPI002469BAB4|nr:hypothetical protein [Arsenophonus sp. aPb]WGL97913.1 hypothetical protein QE177_12055 [Arsenophonus sp. aPb]